VSCPLHKRACPNCAKEETSVYGKGPSGLTVEKILQAKQLLEPYRLKEYQIAFYEEMFTTKEEPMSDAVKRADQVKSDVARLEGENERLKKERDEARAERNRLFNNQNQQRALLIYRDGRVKNTDLPVEPCSQGGFRPARYIYENEAPLYPVSVVDPNYLRTTPVYSRTFLCIHEQSMDAKTIVYVER